MQLTDYMHEDTILSLDAVRDKYQVIEALTDRALQLGYIKDQTAFLQAVRDREALVSTGIGLGIAIPHCKLPDIAEFFIITGLCPSGLDWDSLDKQPVRAVFLIGGPDNRQKDYLRILAKLTLFVKNEKRLEALFQTGDARVILSLFED